MYLQVHAQVDETEIINDEIATEGSSHRMMPNDDEDYEDEDYEDEEISGSSGNVHKKQSALFFEICVNVGTAVSTIRSRVHAREKLGGGY